MLLECSDRIRVLVADAFDIIFVARKTVDVLRADSYLGRHQVTNSYAGFFTIDAIKGGEIAAAIVVVIVVVVVVVVPSAVDVMRTVYRTPAKASNADVAVRVIDPAPPRELLLLLLLLLLFPPPLTWC